MERRIIPKEKLIEIMNQELHKEQEDLEDCNFTGIQLLAEEDADGCNWSTANIRCSGIPMEACSSVANNVVTRAKSEYNIATNE